MTLLLGAFGTALGAWIKVLSVDPDLFYVALIGQTVAAISQVFILGVPSILAAVWFGPDQVSSACSIGVFGNQVRVQFISGAICQNSSSRESLASSNKI